MMGPHTISKRDDDLKTMLNKFMLRPSLMTVLQGGYGIP